MIINMLQAMPIWLNMIKTMLATFSYGVDVKTLIHEINHLLTKDILAINKENGELVKSLWL